MSDDVHHPLEALSALCDLPIRTIRYYIQRGLVDRPIGEKRGAYYTARHVEQLLTIKKWTAAGVSLDRIAELLAGDAAQLPPPRRRPGEVRVWSHLYLGEGVELMIEPGLAGLSPEALRAFARGAEALYQQIRNREHYDVDQ